MGVEVFWIGKNHTNPTNWFMYEVKYAESGRAVSSSFRNSLKECVDILVSNGVNDFYTTVFSANCRTFPPDRALEDAADASIIYAKRRVCNFIEAKVAMIKFLDDIDNGFIFTEIK